MTSGLTRMVVWLNALANTVGGWLLAPIGMLPGWLSATLVSVVTGVLLLWIFKHTSNQRAIQRVRSSIKANLLALRLFKDSTRVMFRSQGRVFGGAFELVVLSIVPMLVMAVPVTLVMTQLALWYQARPLRVGEDTVLTLKLNGKVAAEDIGQWPDVRLQPSDAVDVMTGPVRVLSKREVCWNLRAARPGYHQLVFQIDGQKAEKDLAVGDGFMRVSLKRPDWSWTSALLNPGEPPFTEESAVQWIEIDYPDRSSWTSGTNKWVIYWLIVSMAAALCMRPILHVNI